MSKQDTEQELAEAGGEITEEMDLIWQEKDVAVKDKLDAYGYVFTDLKAEENKLKEIRTKIQFALKRIESTKKKLKVRLNFLSDGESLRGNVFSFHPYTSIHKIINTPEALLDSEIYLTIEIRKDYWKALTSALNEWNHKNNIPEDNIEFQIKKEEAKLTQLPDNHPAITIVGEPSVRIT